jgi:hypothetical protein
MADCSAKLASTGTVVDLQELEASVQLDVRVGEQGLILSDIDYVLDKAGKHLYEGRSFVSRLPESPHSPVELLPLTRPNHVIEDHMPAKLDYCAEWLARWLACCLPREEELQDEVRRLTSKWARS